MNIVTAIISFLANLVGWGRETSARKNTEEVKRNATAIDDTKADDKVKVTVKKASRGNKKAMKDLRKELSE